MIYILPKDAPAKPFYKPWKFSVGSCHAPLVMRTDYMEQLKFIKEELGIERVRFHGIFNDDMNVGLSLKNFLPVPGAGKYREINFYQVGRVYDNILSAGTRPFVELSFMPKILASGKANCLFKYKGNITPPKNLSEWSNFIKEFITFLNDRYGKEEIGKWYFEVWNEPNLKMFFKGSQKDYFELYKATAEAIKAINPDAKVGGPSTAALAWIGEFVDFIKKSGAPCDFVSTHYYPADPIGHSPSFIKMALEGAGNFFELNSKGGGSVLDGARIMLKDGSHKARETFAEAVSGLKKLAGDLPVFLTEWNVTSTCTAPANDTARAASYAVKSVIESDGMLDGMSFWTFSDIFEEIEFFPEPFSGGFGLLDIYGIPKPSFYAFKILNMLGDERYGGNTDGFAAFKKGDATQILLYRQKFGESEKKEEVTIKIEADKAPAEAYAYKINSENCNPLKEWQNLGSPKYLKPGEVEIIKEKSNLKMEKIDFNFENGFVTIKCAIEENEIILTEVR
jgi:Beta-xylosidase